MLPVSIDRLFCTLLPTENPEGLFPKGDLNDLKFVVVLMKFSPRLDWPSPRPEAALI